MADAHEKAAWGCASELEHTHDPKMREHYKQKLQHHRDQAKFNRSQAEEARAKGD